MGRRVRRKRKPVTREERIRRLVCSMKNRGGSRRQQRALTGMLACLGESITCTYCLVNVPFIQMSIDHSMPLSRGGTHDVSNLVACCLPCNSAKGDLDATEFRGLISYLATTSAEATRSVLRRLRAAGWAYRR